MCRAGCDSSDFHRDRDGLRFDCWWQSGRSADAARPVGRRGHAVPRRPGPRDVRAREAVVKPNYAYEKDAAAIYRRSFAVIRGEADLARFSPIEERVAVRVIHACGMGEAAADLIFFAGAVEAARDALRAGAPIFCDARMVAEGVTRSRLPANNDVICTLGDPSTPDLAARLGTTRTAGGIELWLPRLGGSAVAIGHSPRALFP